MTNIKILLTVAAFIFSAQTYAAPTAGAADRLAKQATLITELKAITAEHQSLEKEDNKLAQRWKDLQWGAGENKKQIAKFQAEVTDFNQARAAYEQGAASHNARCSGTFKDGNHVAACNREMEQGRARKQQLIATGNHLDSMRNLINESIRVNTEETQKVFAQHKANEARRNELAAKHAVLLAQLKLIQSEVDKCKAAITGATREKMHDVCGSMFDGNK